MVILLFYVVYIKQCWSLAASILVVLDLIYNLVHLYWLTRYGTVLLTVVLTFMTYINGHVNELNISMYKMIQKYRCKQMTNAQFTIWTNKCRILHTRLVNTILVINGKFWTQVLAIFLLINFPIHAYFTVFLFINRSNINSSIAPILVVLMFQTSGVFFGLLTCAFATEKIQVMRRYLSSVQIHLHTNKKHRKTMFKLKLMSQYEIINSKKSIAFSAGPFGSITYSTILEVKQRN